MMFCLYYIFIKNKILIKYSHFKTDVDFNYEEAHNSENFTLKLEFKI